MHQNNSDAEMTTQEVGGGGGKFDVEEDQKDKDKEDVRFLEI